MSDETINGLQAVINEASKNAVAGTELELYGDTHVVVPKSCDLKRIEDPAKKPVKVKKHVELETMGSFLDYFNRFANDESTIHAIKKNSQFMAVIDHATSDGMPDHEDHTTSYRCPRTTEWLQWKNNSEAIMDQQSFAKFIEDNIPEIVKPKDEDNPDKTPYPTGAEMLEIAMTLSANTKVRFSQGIRLDNGQVQLTYNEEIDGKAGASGQLNIPQVFNLGIKLYEGGEHYAMEARFRYRIKEGQLTMWYELVRPHKVTEAAFDDIYQIIKEGMDKGHIYRGSQN